MKERIFFTKIALVVLLVVLVFVGSGCSLLQVPFALLNEILTLVNKLPKPPPGVF